MLRHSRAQTYIENKKHKERDKNRTSRPLALKDLKAYTLASKYSFNLKEYLKTWGL